MNRRFLQVFGLIALVALVVGSLGALAAVRSKLSITIAEQDGAGARGPDPVAMLGEDVGVLRADVLALSEGLGESLQTLHDALESASARRHEALAAEVQALRRDLARLEGTTAGNEERGRRLAEGLARVEGQLAGLAGPEQSLSGAGWLPAASSPPEVPLVDVEVEQGGGEILDVAVQIPDEISQPPPAEAAPTRSFLSFRLPSQSFAFDRPQRFEVLGSLSRVGFDGKSTLHDFSGTTSAIEGTLESCLARPSELCRGTLRVQARALDTGEEARDEAMREHLAVEEHAEIVFEWTGFEPDGVDVQAQTVSGTARGRMSVRGVTRDFAMPVKVEVDESRRVCIDGEAPLDLRDYDVPVPNKLGVISMESGVKVWISLRLRAVGPADEGAGGTH